jgi:bifunctional non-homologous end joining protein LigD
MPKLSEYRRKRQFEKTPEPRGGKTARKDEKVFVVQKHAARRLHYDLRLEDGGVLKSWAVPKGPSMNPGDKRLAVQVEDHPFDYRTFEGTIPEGNYGAGEVIIWDQGTYEPEGTESVPAQLARGDLKFQLHGHKLNGSFVLVKLKRSQKGNEWLLIKHRDDDADANWNIDEHGESVVSGKSISKKKSAREAQSEAAPPSPAKLPGARSAPMPDQVSVTLAKLADDPFSDPNWLFEIKWDGVRTVAFINDGKVRLVSRTGRDVSAEYTEFQDLAKNVRANTAILDGEIVALDETGRSNFQKLQNRIGSVNPSTKLLETIPLTYYFFDLLYCNGFDIRQSPLLARKELLAQILRGDDRVRYSEHQLEKGKELYGAAQDQGLEGIVGKQIESPYTGNRTGFWLKFKIVNELDAVVIGWTAPRKTRQYFGALVLGLYDGEELKFIGSAGTGFDTKTQEQILKQLKPLKVSQPPFKNPPKVREHVDWVKPEIVVLVKYANWTEDNHLRAPVYLSIRKDRTPEDCTFEAAKPELANPQKTRSRNTPAPITTSIKPAPAASSIPRQSSSDPLKEIGEGKSETLNIDLDGRTLHLTNLNKIYFPESKIRKRDLLAYYYRMADLILPFLKDRPIVMRRYPNGITGKSFFQKEAPSPLPQWLNTATVYSDERGGDMQYVMANDRPSLVFLTNLGCIDHNPWSSRAKSQDYPDYVFFDLDPTPDTPFSTVLRVARAIQRVLRAAQVNYFLKTSGATGFHIYLPLEPVYTYEQARTFAQVISQLVATELPKDTTLERSVSKRPRGRVLLDALQNAKGKPLASVYSVRAFPGAPVSTPVTPKELEGDINPEKWTLRTLDARLREVGDLWKDFWNKRQTLDKPLTALSREISQNKLLPAKSQRP